MSDLEQRIREHDNDYGFDPQEDPGRVSNSARSLSIIIPYFETGSLFRYALLKLMRAMLNVWDMFPDWRAEVIIVDDGSEKNGALEHARAVGMPAVRVIRHGTNMGRMHARQTGLHQARHELCVFMDSDILVDQGLLLESLMLYERSWILNARPSIVAALFENMDSSTFVFEGEEMLNRSSRQNDFRLQCIYQRDWIGCESDLAYAGQEIRILAATRTFRDWKGYYKAWLLTNMVLGGFFLVERTGALSVGGFDRTFNAYGFTETTLVTKLVALQSHFVIPVVRFGAIHVDYSLSGAERARKNQLFREAHRRYFSEYIKQKA